MDAGTTGIQIHHQEYVSADGQWWWDVRVPAERDGITRLDFHMRPAGYLLGLLVDEVGRLYSLPLSLQGVDHDYFRWTEAKEGTVDERGLFPGAYEIQVNDGNLGYPVLGQVTLVAGEVAKARLSFSRELEGSTPTARPRTFAPEAISSPGVSRGSFAPDGRSFYFSRRTGAGPSAFSLHVSVREFGLWGSPTRLDLGEGHGGYGSSPAISPDGHRLVFASHRRPAWEGEADPEPAERASLWMSTKSGDGWSPP